MVANARPLVDDQYARTFAAHGVVIRLPASADDVAGLIFESFFDYRCLSGKRKEGGAEQGFHGLQA